MGAFPVAEFHNTNRLNPRWSTLISFTEVCKGRPNLKRETIEKHFKKLVDPEDYCKKDYEDVINSIMEFVKKQKSTKEDES